MAATALFYSYVYFGQLDEAEQRIRLREEEHQALAGAQALVLEAEHAAEASIGSAELLARWRALTAALRTPVLTRRFERREHLKADKDGVADTHTTIAPGDMVLAAANDAGFDAVGVELSRKRCRIARALTV